MDNELMAAYNDQWLIIKVSDFMNTLRTEVQYFTAQCIPECSPNSAIWTLMYVTHRSLHITARRYHFTVISLVYDMMTYRQTTFVGYFDIIVWSVRQMILVTEGL